MKSLVLKSTTHFYILHARHSQFRIWQQKLVHNLKNCTIRKLQKLEIVDLSTIAQEVHGSRFLFNYKTNFELCTYIVAMETLKIEQKIG